MDFILKASIAVWGLLALVFGVWTIWGILDTSPRTQKIPAKRILGVCADFSVQAKMPLWFVRCCAMLFTPLLIGILFYIAYYFAMLRRKARQPVATKNDVNITRMDSYHF